MPLVMHLVRKVSLSHIMATSLEEDLACLDAAFFGMSKAELEKTDPQQRQLLEVAGDVS